MSLARLAYRSVCASGCLAVALVPVLAAQGVTRAPGITGSVGDFELCPDGTRVVYVADAESDEVYELYGVPIAGGPSRRLNPHPVLGGDVDAFVISPDSRRVAFRADLDRDERFELYSVSITGRAPVRLSPPLVARGDVADFSVSSDSRHVVFRADGEQDGRLELYSAPLAGGPAVKLNVPLLAGEVFEYRISPDGTRVLYKARVEPSQGFGLFSVPVGGGPSAQLNPPLGDFGAVGPFALSPSTKAVVFEFGGHLLATPIAGGAARELAVPSSPFLNELHIHPDGRRVLFLAEEGNGPTQLFSTSLLGGPWRVLNAPLGVAEVVNVFDLAADGSRAVYYVEQGDADVAIYGVSMERGGVVELARPADSRFTITPDSSRVVCLHSDDVWSIPLAGGPGTPLPGAAIDGCLISPDSSRLVYRCSSPGQFITQLFSIALDGGSSVTLNPPLVTGNGVREMRISADSTRVVYSADQDVHNVIELYSVPIGGGVSVQLNPEFPAGP